MRPVVLRSISAVVLGVPALLAIYFGAPWFDAMVAVASALLAWEWFTMCGRGASSWIGWLLGAIVSGATLTAAAAGVLAALGVLGCGAVVVLLASRGHRWLLAGVAYVGLPCVAVLWLRSGLADGRMLVMWLILLVWASDIGAYAAGRSIGGAKLAPRISPNKTWAGLGGGVVCAAAVSVAFSRFSGGGQIAVPAALGSVIALTAQAGDLLESWIKRRFGVKDTSALIPGHGGLLDRVDALIAVILLVSLIAAADTGALLRWLS